ncbi:cytochrome P450 [Aspergillus bertholletiae]|uniref:Cytochrome P450 n=1 Tax=Aspergillus bertholletiae TaxID=1226010 RepID=A0A5N7AQ20_9EURO|nr:cytochrome P450 [Aspergillus bertholletiae]
MEWQIYLGIAFVLWASQVLYIAFTSPIWRIPGPLYTALTGLPLKFASLTGNRIYFVHELHRKYGPIVRIAPDEVDISSLAEFKDIHRAGSPFLKSKWYDKFVPSGRSGVFSMRDPKQHAARRKLFARPFSKSELRRTWESAVKEKAQLAVSQIHLEVMGCGKSDLLKWWTFFATDVSGHLMFGESFDMLRVGKKNEYIHVLESTIMGSGIGAELPLLAWLGRHIPLPSFQHMFCATDYLFQYGQRAITNSRATSNASRNIFAGIVYESEKGDGIITDDEVVLEAGNLIVAGSDTTAITLTYLVWAVLSQPKLQCELEEEVNRLSADFNDAALEELPLLNAVIMEALRLYGAAPGALPRETPAGGATLGGYFIPQGVTVSTQAYSIHRDEEIYPDPERFDVNRWLTTETSTSELAKKAFSPFGAGSRICLGIHLAWMELRLATVQFFRECGGFRLAPSATWESMRPVNYFLISPRGHQCEIECS